MNTRRMILIAVGAVIGLGVAYVAIDRVYLREARDLKQQLSAAERSTRALDKALEDEFGIRDRLGTAIGTTLGRDPERVEHELRAGLGELARGQGLRDVVVSNAAARGAVNPVAGARLSGSWRQLRARLGGRADFFVVRGRVEGTGSLDAALRTLGAMRAQGWIHRVEGFSIKPAGRDRDLYELRADFAIAYAPDLGPADGGRPGEWAPTDERDRAAIAGILARHMFKAPPPAPDPAPITPEPARVAQTPPPPAYGQWRLVGLTVTDHPEAIVVGPSDESRVLTPGQGVEGAVFEGGEGELGVFVIGGERFEVELGRTLAERRGLED